MNDSLAKRLCQLAETELGKPPMPYAWIVFGSEGRSEQLLLTDQDNAIVYQAESEAAKHYFKALAERVVAGLIEAGFPPCTGGYMATNFCRPLEAWINIFLHLLREPEPKNLMHAGVFFDFRVVHGSLSLQPIEDVISEAHRMPLFMRLLMSEAQHFRPPLGLFNRIQHENGKVDLKMGGIVPITALARTVALAAGSQQRTTLERLTAAVEANIITAEGVEALSDVFQYLLTLRLRTQLTALHAHQPLDNKVDLKQLSTLEKERLKAAFVTIRQQQQLVGYEFHLDGIR